MRSIVLALFVLGSACSPMRELGRRPVRAPSARDLLGEGSWSCPAGLHRKDPLVVEWPADVRAALAAGMERGAVVLAGSCKGVEVLTKCTARARYAFTPVPLTRTVAHLDAGSSGHQETGVGDASLHGSTAVDVALTYVGLRATERSSISRDELQGDCDDARYVVTKAWVGAFRAVSSTHGRASSFDEVSSLRVGGESNKTILHEDGILASCEAHTADAKAAPPQCNAPVRVELGMVVEKREPAVSASSEPLPEQTPASTTPALLFQLEPGHRMIRMKVDADGVYLFEQGRGLPPRFRLRRLPPSGSIETLAEVDDFGELALDPRTIYWANETGVHALDKRSGAAPRRIAALDSKRADIGSAKISVDDTHVYLSWYLPLPSGEGRIERISKDGRERTTLVRGLRTPKLLGVDRENVYWADTIIQGTGELTPFTMALFALPKRGGGKARVIYAPLESPHSFATDADSIYWMGYHGNERGALYRVLKTGSSPTVVADALPMSYRNPLLTEGGHVYWSDYRHGMQFNTTTLRSVAKTGGTPVTLATLVDRGANLIVRGASLVALDERRIYFADSGFPEIYALPRR